MRTTILTCQGGQPRQQGWGIISISPILLPEVDWVLWVLRLIREYICPEYINSCLFVIKTLPEPTRMAVVTRLDNNKCWQGCRELEPSYTAGGSVKWCSCFGKQSGSSSKSLQGSYDRSSNSTPRYPPKRNENIHPCQNMSMNVHNVIHSSPRVETTQIPVNQ